MPIDAYYGGHGRDVMRDMQKRYGAKKGKSVFYATAEKRGLKEHLGDMMKRGAFSKKKAHSR